MSMSANLHNVVKCTHRPLDDFRNDALKFMSDDGADITIFVLPHVAAATAAAFNAAMAEQPAEQPAERTETEGAPA